MKTIINNRHEMTNYGLERLNEEIFLSLRSRMTPNRCREHLF